MSGADTAWILVATGLVLFMTLPGLALFYGGLVRARNVLSLLMQCVALACVMSLLWLALGYSIAFGGEGALWGGFGRVFLAGVGVDTLKGTLPESLFFAFQMTFAIITPALIIGAFVERVRFDWLMLFSSAWMLLVYAPVAHWVWGGGWLAGLGVWDFAGGIVVHETAGLAALIVAAMIGPRRGFARHEIKPPHNPGMTMIGASMLWVGWFGFNGGSQLAADGGAAMAVVVTHLSACAGAIAWSLYERYRFGKSSLIGAVTGLVGGLATVTPASGYIGPMGALILGAVSGVVCQKLCGVVKEKLRIDDTLDVFAVHGVGGIMGTLAAPVLALPVLGGRGLPEGVSLAHKLGVQALALVAVGVFTVVLTWVIAKACAALTPMRVDEEQEFNGLDYESHGERAYDWAS